jgi:hypothetical protein
MLRVIKHIIVEVRLPLDRLRAWNGARERWGDFSDPQQVRSDATTQDPLFG